MKTRKSKSAPKRWRRTIPDRNGWWRFREDGMPPSEQSLLIVTARDHAEVAEDGCMAEELGREVGEDENYWEATDCSEMPGLWMFERGPTFLKIEAA